MREDERSLKSFCQRQPPDFQRPNCHICKVKYTTDRLLSPPASDLHTNGETVSDGVISLSGAAFISFHHPTQELSCLLYPRPLLPSFPLPRARVSLHVSFPISLSVKMHTIFSSKFVLHVSELSTSILTVLSNFLTKESQAQPYWPFPKRDRHFPQGTCRPKMKSLRLSSAFILCSVVLVTIHVTRNLSDFSCNSSIRARVLYRLCSAPCMMTRCTWTHSVECAA